MATTAAGPARHPSGEPHRAPVEAVLAALDVDLAVGLGAPDAADRLARFGPNVLPEAERVPGWRRFARQFGDVLILILLAAAAVSFVATGELKTPAVVLAVVVFNASLGYVQERRAEAALEALRAMLVTTAKVRRQGTTTEVAARDLVPGDVVLLEAGDRVPADGRLAHVVGLEVEESALTGESTPVAKVTTSIDQVQVPLAERVNMGFTNATVTRGRAEMVVTATGADTEIGRLAGLLRAAEPERSPLQRQLDGLARSLAVLAGVVVVLVVAAGLVRGQEPSGMIVTAVALAVASIPEGLPAVTAVTLALGVARMARAHAIVKRLASVETLGCTSVICTDKTGTLTLNQMTVRQVVVGDRPVSVTGQGDAPFGDRPSAELGPALHDALVVMALCSDAVLQQDASGARRLIGDPTEGALVVLAAEGGVDVEEVRARLPRLAEVPFDSAHRFMATFHEMRGPTGAPAGRVCAKGALDALLPRAATAVGSGGEVVPIDAMAAALVEQGRRMAASGLRVLAIASRDVELVDLDVAPDEGPASLVEDLTIVALVGIQDPPRPEAAAAIAQARLAGIDVKMLTGDHAATATAIARELELVGSDGQLVTVTGIELDGLDQEELAARLPEIGVFARVDPQHKLRLVEALQARGHVVAATGDGVNDAPALKRADIGVAMGVTGTDVTREAATMVLADDNFATIVRAVRQGRTIYDNIVKFVRFQVSTTLGFAAVFLGAAASGLAGGKPFTAIAILWVNVIMDGPPAMSLALDPTGSDVMQRPPRPRAQPLLTADRWSAIAFSAVVMATGTLAVLAAAPGPTPAAGTPSVAGTMALNTFVLFQFFNILNVRNGERSVLERQTLTNPVLWSALALVVSLQVAVTHLGPLQRLFATTSLTLGQWAVCAATASAVLWAEELRKLVSRKVRAPARAPGLGTAPRRAEPDREVAR